MKRTAILLIALTFVTPSFAGDVLTPETLLVLIRENSTAWEKEALSLSGELLDSDLNERAYAPSWYLAPSYAFSAPLTRDGEEAALSDTAALILGFSRLLPTNGTISLELEEGSTLIRYGGDSSFMQNLSAGISYTQPFLYGDRLIERDAYADTRRITVDIPRAEASLRSRMNRSALTARILSRYYGLLLSEESFRLGQKKQKLVKRELALLSSMKERGLYSGTDYWKKQLEAEQGEDELLEMDHDLRNSRRDLAEEIGIEGDFILPRLALTERVLPPVPEELWSLWPRENGEWRLAEMREERARLAARSAVSGKPSLLSMDFSLTPGYAPGSSPDRGFSRSFSDLFLPESPLAAEFSLSLSYSPTQSGSNRIRAKRDATNRRTAGLEKEEMMAELLSEKEELENRDEMLRLKLDRIDESIEYLTVLHEKEKKLLELASTTPLAVDEAGLNLELRKLDRQTALVDLYRNRLDLLALAGADLSGEDGLPLPGGNL